MNASAQERIDGNAPQPAIPEASRAARHPRPGEQPSEDDRDLVHRLTTFFQSPSDII
jgi:hypothetical protein